MSVCRRSAVPGAPSSHRRGLEPLISPSSWCVLPTNQRCILVHHASDCLFISTAVSSRPLPKRTLALSQLDSLYADGNHCHRVPAHPLIGFSSHERVSPQALELCPCAHNVVAGRGMSFVLPISHSPFDCIITTYAPTRFRASHR